MRMRPYRTLEDKIEGVVVTFVDVTERQEAETRWEERQKLLLSELSHRVKNIFAVVQSVVSQTLRGSGASAQVLAALESRLQAIGRSHELLVGNEWNGAYLADVAREQLAGYLSQKPSRIRLEGPPVHLGSDAATPFGLLLNELATNAAKYGALSNGEGRVNMIWELIEGDRGRRLKVMWSERGGPPVSAPKETGFGSYLIDRGLPEARVQREFRPGGLVCTIEMPVT
jgi:two-component system CheB/CheR fusion protein